MSVEIIDKENNKVVATPEFYQHANAMGGAWSIGGTDNAMLSRVASLISDYIRGNYNEAIGGPTGKPAESK